jgi:hypothetical protein
VTVYVNSIVDMAGNCSKTRLVSAAKALALILADNGSENDDDVECSTVSSDSDDAASAAKNQLVRNIQGHHLA